VKDTEKYTALDQQTELAGVREWEGGGGQGVSLLQNRDFSLQLKDVL
jgi:hypothetical protein